MEVVRAESGQRLPRRTVARMKGCQPLANVGDPAPSEFANSDAWSSEAVRAYRPCPPQRVSDLIKCDACAWDVCEQGMVRGVKKLVNTSDVLCINGIDVVKLVNQLVNNSFELVKYGRGRGSSVEDGNRRKS